MHYSDTLLFSVFLIFTGTAILSTIAMYTRQPLLLSYILLGVLIGPWGMKLVTNDLVIKQIGDVGIIFLLFLLGLNLHPQKLFHMLRKATVLAVVSSLVFATMGYVIGRLFGYTNVESLVIGAAMMFSSTIIGLKLLPTTILHHRHTGEVMISVLLLQDLLAIFVLMLITGVGAGGLTLYRDVMIVMALPLLLLIGFLAERYLLVKLFARFDHIKEYIFLLSIGWCLGMAQIALSMGLSEGIGALIAGVSLAASPIALYIAESLKPLRDFFLVLFFFSIGASFNMQYLPGIIVPALLLALMALTIKPFLFNVLLRRTGEGKRVSWEVAVRLGQASEFSLLIAYLASSVKHVLIGQSASYLIQAMTIMTFFVSSYWVVLRYPTPLALTSSMRKD